MLDITKDIQSLTTFRRRSGDFMKQLKKSKRPVVLTVKGKAAAIVQDAEAYQRLLDIAARADSEEGIRQGLDDVAHGRTRPAKEVFDDIRRKHGIFSLSLVAEIDCLVGCGGAPLATYFVKLAPMPGGHRRRNGATTSSIFCCDCGSRKYDGGRRAKAAHVTAIAEPTDP
jgi:prevent-host-death family protein